MAGRRNLGPEGTTPPHLKGLTALENIKFDQMIVILYFC
jgi:hypothetical protein